MKKLFHTKIIPLIIVIISIIICSFSNNIFAATSMDIFETTYLISACNNDFLLLTYNNDTFKIYNISEDDISKTANENFSVKSYFFANDELFIVCKNERNLPIVKCGNSGAVLDAEIISNISLKENCITAVKHDYIYLVDSKNPKTVCKYTIDGTEYDKYTFDKDIKSLFTDKSNENAYAIIDGGIICIESNTFISCYTPTAPYNFYGNYCCDSAGKVFLFDDDEGFELVTQTDYENLCVLNNTVYGSKDNIVYMLSDEGAPTAKYVLDSKVQQLSVSNSKMAVLCNNDVQFLYKENFISIINEDSNNSYNSLPDNSQISFPEQSSTQNNAGQSSEAADYSISSSVYTFSDDMIMNIPQGTTIAKFKSNVSYGENSIQFTNHNNQIKTSGTIGTGWRVDFSGNGRTVSYYIIIYGDLTGEGNINSRDITALSNYLVEKSEFSKYQLYASDINEDGISDSLDLLLIRKMIK